MHNKATNFFFILLLVFLVSNVKADTYTVTNLNDAGTGSLRQAILDANANPNNLPHVIDMRSLNGVINISSELVINRPTQLLGSGRDNLRVKAANAGYRILSIQNQSSAGDFLIKDIAISHADSYVYGAAIYIYELPSSTTVSIEDCLIEENIAISRGAGIYAQGSDTYFFTLSIKRSIIRKNSAGGYGGGAYLFGANYVIEDCIIEENKALYGGGFYITTGTLRVVINNSLFKGNLLSNASNTNGDYGSALRIFSCREVIINNSTFTGHQAILGTGAGTIAHNDADAKSLILNHCTIYNNEAKQGGAIYNSRTSTNNIEVNNCIITENTATTDNSENIYGNINSTSGHNVFGVTTGGTLLGTTTGNVTNAAASAVLNTTLADNGGNTQTFALAAGSIAKDLCTNVILATDQRGFLRDSSPDAGAFENSLEINVQGNNTDIANNDTSPSTTDNTDFGDVIECGTASVSKTFTIQSLGRKNLTVSSITVGGTNATDFVLGALPTFPVSLAQNATQTFSVTFNPSATANRTATINIANNDGDENPYIFTIQGNGTVETELPVLTAKADVTRNIDVVSCSFTNTDIPDGSATDNCTVASYSYVLTGATTGTVSTLANQAFNVGVTTITWTATDAAGNVSLSDEFTVTVSDNQNPTITCSSNIIATSEIGTCTKKVTYPFPFSADNGCAYTEPIAGFTYLGSQNGKSYYISNVFRDYQTAKNDCRAAGGYLAHINDAAENDFINSLTAQAYIAYDDLETEGTFVWDNGQPSTYTNWIGGIAPSIPANDATLMEGNGFWSNVPIGNYYKYVLEISGGLVTQTAGLPPRANFPVGTTTNTFAIIDAAGNSSTCSFDVNVVGGREIDILGNSVSITDGDITPSTTDNTDFGSVSGSKVVTYTIQNTVAGSNLTVANIVVSGTNAADFVVSNFTNNTTVAGNATTTFDVTYTPSAATTSNATITITNSDCDEAVYDFAIKGTKINPVPPPPPAPIVPVNAGLSLSAIADSDTKIELSWTTNSDATAYRLYRGQEFVKSFLATTTSYSDEDLEADTFYRYKLIAVIDNRDSAPSTAQEWTYPAKPILDSVVTLCQEGNAFVAFSSTGNKYKIYAQEEGGEKIDEQTSDSFELPFVDSDSAFYVSTTGIRSKKESERTKVNVSVQAAFEAKILGDNLQFSCVDALVLNAEEVENATSYIWSRNGVEVGKGKTFTAKFAVEYQVRVTRGACTFISKPVRVELNQTPVARILEKRADNEVTFCQTGNLTASFAGQNATYSWTLNNTEIAQTRNISASQSGTYVLSVSTNGCVSSTEINVVIVAEPQIPVLVASTSTLCPTEKTTLSIENPENGVIYNWFRNGRSARLEGDFIETDIAGTYSIEAISDNSNLPRNSCRVASNSVQIDRFEVVPVYLRVSEDKKKLFLESASSSNEIVSVEWYFDGEIKLDLGTSSELLPTEEGYYSALVTNQNGCSFKTRTVYFSTPKDDDDVVTGNEDLREDTFNIYPNPNTGTFKVHFSVSLSQNIEVTIFDGIGRKVSTQIFERGNQDFNVNLKDQAKGMYLIHFNQNGATYSRQVVIE